MISQNSRDKRLIELLTVGLSAYNRYEQSKIIKHLRQVDNQIKSLTKADKDIAKMMHDNVKFEGDLIRLFDKLNLMEARINMILTCEFLHSDLMVELNVQLDRWMNKIENILTFINAGTITGALTPSIVNFETLKNLVAHSAINSTIFNLNPELLYRHGKLHFRSASTSLDRFHFALTFPDLSPLDTLPTLYSIKQVGFRPNNSKVCVDYDIPNHVIEETPGEFSFIDVTECDKNGRLMTCERNRPTVTEAACLTNTTNTCPVKPLNTCKSRYLMTSSGLLVFSQEGISVKHRVSNSSSNKVQQLEPIFTSSKSNTLFLDWADVAMVVIGNTLIQAPDLPGIVVKLTAPYHMDTNFNTTINSSINVIFNTTALSRIVNKQNDTISDFENILADIPDFVKKDGHKIGYSAITVIVVCFLIIFLIIWCCYSKSRDILNSDVVKQMAGPNGRGFLLQMDRYAPVLEKLVPGAEGLVPAVESLSPAVESLAPLVEAALIA